MEIPQTPAVLLPQVDGADCSIPDAVPFMARSHSLRTVAEGMEIERQLDFQVSQRCDAAQGLLRSVLVAAEQRSAVEISRKRSSVLGTRSQGAPRSARGE